MGFTAAAFIRYDIPRLRKKLEELEYKNCGNPLQIANDNKSIATIDGEYVPCDIPLDGSFIDCGDGEELFLTVAALRDDIDEDQWFICDVNHWDRSDNGETTVYTEIGEWIFCKSSDNNYARGSHYHKVTVEKLIAHFKGREE